MAQPGPNDYRTEPNGDHTEGMVGLSHGGHQPRCPEGGTRFQIRSELHELGTRQVMAPLQG